MLTKLYKALSQVMTCTKCKKLRIAIIDNALPPLTITSRGDCLCPVHASKIIKLNQITQLDSVIKLN